MIWNDIMDKMLWHHNVFQVLAVSALSRRTPCDNEAVLACVVPLRPVEGDACEWVFVYIYHIIYIYTAKSLILRRTKSPNVNASRLVLQLSLPDPMKPGVKSRMKMQLEQRCSNYIWVIDNFIAY